MTRITVNGQIHDVDAAPDTPLLWVLRDHLRMTGTKFACGIAACGACTVLLDGEPVRSCVLPLAALDGQSITTIEGLANDAGLHPVQQAWIDHQVPQCGYCQSGMILASAALLEKNPDPDEADIERAVTNICRCGTYPRVKQAILALGGGTVTDGAEDGA